MVRQTARMFATSEVLVLTLPRRVPRIQRFGDVAELADAQVSEACDGDIVEVQVLSSPRIAWASSHGSPFLILSVPA